MECKEEKGASMAEQKRYTRDDVFLRTRIFADGVRYVEKGTSAWDPLPEQGTPANPIFIQDGSGMIITTRPNPRSRLDCVMDGSNVTISEMGEVLCTGKLEPRAPWRDIEMSDGTIVDSAFRGTNEWSDILVNAGCTTAGSGKGCQFCLYTGLPLLETSESFEEKLARAERSIEATAIAIQNGWKGMILFVGGAMLPERRDQWATDLFEAYMAKFHDYLDDDILSTFSIRAHVYPPNDLQQMYKWKRLGINTAQYDCQVMDPAYFRAICPGRGDQKRWFEAQEAAVEVFGPDGGSTGNIVGGLEPMASMLEGIEERISKGVHCMANVFYPLPGTPLEHWSPAPAEWYMEAWERAARIYSRYGHTYDLDYDLPDVKLSIESNMEDLLADHRAKAILVGLGMDGDNPQMQQAAKVSLKQIAGYSEGAITDEMLKQVDEKLSKL